MRHSFRYYLSVLGLFAFFAYIPSAIAIWLGANGIIVLLIYLVGMVVCFYFDKRIDDTWRGTVARK